MVRTPRRSLDRSDVLFNASAVPRIRFVQRRGFDGAAVPAVWRPEPSSGTLPIADLQWLHRPGGRCLVPLD
jgi:hypothetical protein